MSPTISSPDSADLARKLSTIAEVSYTTDIAVKRMTEELKTALAQQRQALLQQLEQALPEKQDTVAIAKQYGSGSPQDALALGKNVTIAKVHKILIKARENRL